MKPSTSVTLIHCQSCFNAVNTPAEKESYPDGECPVCQEPWTGTENTGVRVFATVPEGASGQA